MARCSDAPAAVGSGQLDGELAGIDRVLAAAAADELRGQHGVRRLAVGAERDADVGQPELERRRAGLQPGHHVQHRRAAPHFGRPSPEIDHHVIAEVLTELGCARRQPGSICRPRVDLVGERLEAPGDHRLLRVPACPGHRPPAMSARSRNAAVVRGTGLLSYGALALGFRLWASAGYRLRLQATGDSNCASGDKKQQADGAATERWRTSGAARKREAGCDS